MSELFEFSAFELADMMEKREISAVELTKSVIDRRDQTESVIGAYLTKVEMTEALQHAEQIDRKRAEGEELPRLAGVPYALKDNICTKGIQTTCASRMLEGFKPPYSATVAKKLIDTQGIMLGKLNMDEFAMGSSTETSYFQETHNPWDIGRVPGGSSGGSAASVSAHSAVYSLGTDTGGSIRQPASLCGVVGLKPTYGRVSRYGVVAFASSLDQVGPLTKCVTDSALVLEAISGVDPKDASSVPAPIGDYYADLTKGVKGMRVGLPLEYFGKGICSDVKGAVEQAAQKLKEQGAIVEDCSIMNADHALAAYYIISSAEACSNLGRYDGIRYGHRARDYDGVEDMIRRSRNEGFGTEVKRRILLGTYALSAGYYDAYYKRAQQVRTLIIQDFNKLFDTYDVLLTPTSPTTAWKFGEKSNCMESYASDICTVAVNVAGLPAISLPCGLNSQGLPIGAQIIGKALHEGDLFRTAYALEQALEMPKKERAL